MMKESGSSEIQLATNFFNKLKSVFKIRKDVQKIVLIMTYIQGMGMSVGAFIMSLFIAMAIFHRIEHTTHDIDYGWLFGTSFALVTIIGIANAVLIIVQVRKAKKKSNDELHFVEKSGMNVMDKSQRHVSFRKLSNNSGIYILPALHAITTVLVLLTGIYVLVVYVRSERVQFFESEESLMIGYITILSIWYLLEIGIHHFRMLSLHATSHSSSKDFKKYKDQQKNDSDDEDDDE